MQELIHHFSRLEGKELDKTIELNFTYYNVVEGMVLSAEQRTEVMKTEDSITVALCKKYLLETDIHLDYCSVYNSCWSLKNDVTEELK